MNEHRDRNYTRSAPLTRNTNTADKKRKDNGGSWGSGRIDHNALERMPYNKGGKRQADYTAIKVILDANTNDDPRITWAAIEEHLPADLETEYQAITARDRRHFLNCPTCKTGPLCETGQQHADIRNLLLDIIALRNRGYALLHAPTQQVPGSAYGNFR